MAIIQVNNPDAAASLLAHFGTQEDLWAEQVGPETVRASVLGSYSFEAMNVELVLRLRAWEAAERARGNVVTADVLHD
jgi:hypothetical protein